MICLNGNQVSDCEGLSLEDFIAKQNFEKNKIAVEINGEIIPKKDYETVQIKENDVLVEVDKTTLSKP